MVHLRTSENRPNGVPNGYTPEMPSRPRTALVLGGGGISGAAYEAGCLAALEEVFGEGFCRRAFDIYVGVSAGAIIASLVAGGISPLRLRDDILNERKTNFNFQRSDVYRFDLRGFLQTTWDATRRMTGVLNAFRREGLSFSLLDLADVLQELLPSGCFSLEPLEGYLRNVLVDQGMGNAFHDLEHKLYVPAIDLDQANRVVFGDPEWADVPISEAVVASCAIPAFFQPWKIGNRSFVDGCMGGVCHLDVAIDRGATRLLVINPMVPFDAGPERSSIRSLATGKACGIADMGITFVSDQALRIMGRDRLEHALRAARQDHPEVDIALIEPSRSEPLLFVHGPMSFEARARILHYAYESTLTELRDHADEVAALLDTPRLHA